jgi:hypothetical protein
LTLDHAADESGSADQEYMDDDDDEGEDEAEPSDNDEAQ